MAGSPRVSVKTLATVSARFVERVRANENVFVLTISRAMLTANVLMQASAQAVTLGEIDPPHAPYNCYWKWGLLYLFLLGWGGCVQFQCWGGGV